MIFQKKKLCSQNENFPKSFVTLIFFSVTNVKKLPRLFSKKKKWTNICPFFQKVENTFEKRQLFDISHILGWSTICYHKFIYIIYFVTCYHAKNNINHNIIYFYENQQKIEIFFWLYCKSLSVKHNNNNNNKMSSVSLFIPFALVNHTAEFIKNVVENKARLGKVAQVDVITKMNSTRNKYNIAYVYFERWNDDEPTKKFLTDLKSSVKPVIRYEKDSGNSMNPTYWKVVENILVEKRKTKTLPLNSHEEFPVIGTPPRNVRFAKTPPPAPRKSHVTSCVINLNKEELNAIDDELSCVDIESMNLVDDGYVSKLEEENQRLREENDRIVHFYTSQIYMLNNQISQLWNMTFRY